MTQISTPHQARPSLFWLVALALLALPAIAMALGAEGVHWDGFDFLFAAVLFSLTGLAWEFLRRRGPMPYRVGAGLAVVGCLLTVWVNGAVGMIGSEDNPANLLYAGVLSAVIGGSLLSHFRARGMTVTMLVAAMLQAAIGLAALALDLGTDGRAWPRDVIGVTVIFTALWLAAAGAFARSISKP
jgi:hypothetical protein